MQSQKITGKKNNDELELMSIDSGRNRNKENLKSKNTHIENELSNMALLESNLKVVAGVIPDSDVFKLSKLIFRVSHGKVATYTKPVG